MRDLRAKDSGRYNVRGLCVLFGKSKQAYYQYDENLALGKAAREEFALEYVRGIRARDPGIGGVKLWHMYQKEFSCDGPIGRDRFCRIIDENRLKVRQLRLCGDAPPQRDTHQHDRVRRPEGERAGRAHQQHDEERAAQGQGLPFPGRGHRGHGSGGRLLQQPPTAHEHRHDDSGRGFRDIRGQGYEMEELQDDGNKKQE